MQSFNYSDSAPLSRVEADTLAHLERAGRSIVTLDQLGERLGRRRAYELVRSLTKKRVFTRIGRGLYSVRPFRAHGRPWMIPAPVAAAHLLAAEPYYLGGRLASWLHKLTRQVPGSRITLLAVALATATAGFYRGATRDPLHHEPSPIVTSSADALPTREPEVQLVDPPLSRRERVAAVMAERLAARHHQWLPEHRRSEVCRSHEGWIVTICDADRPWNTATTIVRLSSDLELLGFGPGRDWCDDDARPLP